MPDERLMCCVLCKSLIEFNGDTWLEVRIEIAWVSGSGCSPEGFGLAGLCDDCAGALYSLGANALRAAVGEKAVGRGDEPALIALFADEASEGGEQPEGGEDA